jgi:hypothetical protein
MSEIKPGDMVVLVSVPSSLIDNLPVDDQIAIRSAIGKKVTFAGISYGQAEIEFIDESGNRHTIWVDKTRIKSLDEQMSKTILKGADLHET